MDALLSRRKLTVAFPSSPQASGGPGSFQSRFEEELLRQGWGVLHRHELPKTRPDIIFVIAGSRRLFWLITNKLRGVPVIQRLDGVEWQNKYKKGSMWRRMLKPRLEELAVIFIYRFLADAVIYQSRFVESCWHRKLSYRPRFTEVIKNGVNVKAYRSINNEVKRSAAAPPRLVCVEGEVQSFEAGIGPLIDLADYLLKRKLISGVTVVGRIERATEKRLLSEISNIEILGELTREQTRLQYQNAIYYVIEINAACPNSLIEALVCGCPVLAFDTGALRELIPDGAGELVPFSGNPWALEVPDPLPLREAALNILNNFSSYSAAAETAGAALGVESMTKQYSHVFKSLLVAQGQDV